MTLSDAELKKLIELAEENAKENLLWEQMNGCKDMPMSEIQHIFPGYDPSEGTDLHFKFTEAANPDTVKAMAEELLAARAVLSFVPDKLDTYHMISEKYAALLSTYLHIVAKNEGEK